ncbi:hypothetical protein SDC9_97547 [bioreactor metagenome]|uniref:Uncharacterized protein n=1 Tax=bioreactor metagenome TaxID=1076179 RepID=A0A645AMF0_9ZZZZ
MDEFAHTYFFASDSRRCLPGASLPVVWRRRILHSHVLELHEGPDDCPSESGPGRDAGFVPVLPRRAGVGFLPPVFSRGNHSHLGEPFQGALPGRPPSVRRSASHEGSGEYGGKISALFQRKHDNCHHSVVGGNSGPLVPRQGKASRVDQAGGHRRPDYVADSFKVRIAGRRNLQQQDIKL